METGCRRNLYRYVALNMMMIGRKLDAMKCCCHSPAELPGRTNELKMDYMYEMTGIGGVIKVSAEFRSNNRVNFRTHKSKTLPKVDRNGMGSRGREQDGTEFEFNNKRNNISWLKNLLFLSCFSQDEWMKYSNGGVLSNQSKWTD